MDDGTFPTPIVIERGWPGHFICADRCLFRRNTLIILNGKYVVVSTVGKMIDIHAEGWPNKITFDNIGCDRYAETMAFVGKQDGQYIDADVTQQIYFDSPWSIDNLEEEGIDNKMNDMHDNVVRELYQKMQTGKLWIATNEPA